MKTSMSTQADTSSNSTISSFIFIKMCRNTVGICLICLGVQDNVIPCETKTEESPATTLFTPTKCINSQTILMSYHGGCVDQTTFDWNDPYKVFVDYFDVITNHVPHLYRCDNPVVDFALPRGVEFMTSKDNITESKIKNITEVKRLAYAMI